jgi:hypothetical protein
LAVISGGTTLIDNGALDAGVPTGSLILLSTQTASASATISFTSGIDSTYDSYVFKFYDIHPSVASDVDFSFQGSTNSGSSYGIAITSTYFNAYHPENDAYSGLSYDTGMDLAQSTSYQNICDNINGSHNDASMCGFLNLFNPSSTTFVKHFISRTTHMENDPRTMDNYIGGYINTTSAINAIQFKFSSGNIDDGIIKLYGVK